MTSHGVLRSMIWKDYRELRAFWIATLMLAVALQTIVGIMTTRLGMASYTLIPMLAWALVTPALYALGCAAMMFAGEHESGMYHFLRALPVDPVRLLVGRTVFVLASTLLMLAATCGSFVVVNRALAVGAGDVAVVFGCFAIVPLELFVYGVLFSLASRRPLAALLLGATFGAGMPMWIAMEFQMAAAPRETAADWWPPLLAVRLVVIALIAAIDVWLAARWFRDDGVLWGRRRQLLRAGMAVNALADSDRSSSRTTRSTFEFSRLLWQQSRQSWRLAVLFIPATLVAAALCVAAMGSLVGRGPHEPLVLLLVPLAGACVFRADWQGDRYRFLAECGASPGRVWLTRQLVWFGLSVLILVITMVLFAVARFEPIGRSMSNGEDIRLFFLLISPVVMLAAYACGQFCSIYARSSIVAGMASYGLLLSLLAWTSVIMALRVNWLWSVLPIPFALLVATRLRIRDWMLGRTDWRARLRAAMVPVVPIATILVAVPLHRVYSVPGESPKFPPEVLSRQPTPEELATARMYAEAYQTYVPLVQEDDEKECREASASRLWERGSSEGTASFERPPVPAKFAARLKANRKTIDATVRASRRPTCLLWSAFSHDLDNSALDADSVECLGTLLVIDAKHLTTTGKLDKALDRYLAAVRVANHLYQSGAMREGSLLYDLAEWGLLCWAAAPDQTAERIDRALKEFTSIQTPPPSLAHVVARHWRASRKQLAEIDSRRCPRQSTDNPVDDWAPLAQAAALQWLPWERTRACRIIDYLACVELEDVHLFQTALNKNCPGDVGFNDAKMCAVDALLASAHLPGRDYPMEIGYWIGDTLLNLTRDRAFRLQMALAAWRRAHGEVPESLDELVGTYLDAVPIDPYTGRPFRYYPQGLPERKEEPMDMMGPPGAASPPPPESHGPLVWSPLTSLGLGEPSLQYSCGKIFPVP